MWTRVHASTHVSSSLCKTMQKPTASRRHATTFGRTETSSSLCATMQKPTASRRHATITSPRLTSPHRYPPHPLLSPVEHDLELVPVELRPRSSADLVLVLAVLAVGFEAHDETFGVRLGHAFLGDQPVDRRVAPGPLLLPLLRLRFRPLALPLRVLRCPR